MKLLAAAKASRERDWLMILVAFWHGLRASEVVGLTGDNVKDGFISVQRLKGSNRTTQALVSDPNPLLDERAALLDYARNSAGNQKLFGISRQHFWLLVRRHAERAGIPSHLAHPHILKHSIAMQTIHSAGIENVRVHLGHKSIGSTGAYLKVPEDQASDAVVSALRVKAKL